MDLLSFIAWLTYYLLHSLLAADRVKAVVHGQWPSFKSWYRLSFNVFSFLGLLLLVWLTWSRADSLLFGPSALTRLAGAVLLAGGAIMGWAAFRSYNTAEFLGTDVLRPEPPDSPVLAVGGLNAWVRHPLYTASLMGVLGLAIVWPLDSVVSATLATLVYLPLGIYWEEKKLLRQFGDAYRSYQQRVKRLLPGIW